MRFKEWKRSDVLVHVDADGWARSATGKIHGALNMHGAWNARSVLACGQTKDAMSAPHAAVRAKQGGHTSKHIKVHG